MARVSAPARQFCHASIEEGMNHENHEKHERDTEVGVSVEQNA